MIRPAERVGFMAGAGCMLLALHATFWPWLPGIADLDNTTPRWIWGLGSHVLAVAALTSSAMRARKATVAWLAVFVVVSAIGFAVLRSPNSLAAQIWATYWPVVMVGAAFISVLLANLSLHNARWEPFGEPFYLAGILVAPMIAITGIAFHQRLRMPNDVPTMAFAGLTVTYLLASFFPGPRKLVILAVVCASVCVMHLLGCL
jgi:hypothetical protein